MNASTVFLNLRLPPDLHARLKARAEVDRRSLNAEIVWLLENATENTEGEPT